jgi:hypothetical protein
MVSQSLLSNVFNLCRALPRGAAPVIKAYSPELIVHPYLLETRETDEWEDLDHDGDPDSPAAMASAALRAKAAEDAAAEVGLSLGRVSNWLHGYRLSSTEQCFDCKITW